MNQGTQSPTPQGNALLATPRLIYSYTEARELLGGVPVSTFSGWLASGILVPVKIGSQRRFIRHEDLMALAQGNTQGKAQPKHPKTQDVIEGVK